MLNYLRVLNQLRILNQRSRWNLRRLREYQDGKLREIIRYAYGHVPFFHKRFRDLGLRPEDIQTGGDLKKLPIIRKNEIRKNLSDMISDQFCVTSLRRLSTSGSTGEPLFLYVSRQEDEFRKAKHLRANISCGQKARDRWVTITAPHHFGLTTRLQRTVGFYAPISLSVFIDTLEQIAVLEKIAPHVIDGYSSSLVILAKELEKRKIHTIKPRLVIGGAELVDEASRRFVEKVLEAPFFDQYSSVEFERMAWQCSAQSGYHMDADAIIMQFVDDAGEEVSVGERGEIVCTSLFNYAMPFIRYAIGDVGIQSGDSCSCGRTLPLLKIVEGRKDSILALPDGRMLTPRVLTSAMRLSEFYEHIDQFRIIQKKSDLFKLIIKLKPNGLQQSVVEARLKAHLESILMVKHGEITFDVEFVDSIPLDRTGKLMIVVSELKSKIKN